MSVNSYLKDLGSTLVLSESEKNSIKKSIDTIKSRLSAYFSDIEDMFIFGSYSRGTILPRKSDDDSDVDLMVVFRNEEGHKPQSFLNRLKNFAERYYSTSEIYQSSPTIVLELNHIKFELVPAYKLCGIWYYIPQNASTWQRTDPIEFSDELNECNKNNNYKIKPVIRLIKHWNVQKNKRSTASFEIEKKIANGMKYSYLYCSTYAAYLKRALEVIRPVSDGKRIDEAIEHITEALSLETSGYPISALAEIKKAFPEV